MYKICAREPRDQRKTLLDEKGAEGSTAEGRAERVGKGERKKRKRRRGGGKSRARMGDGREIEDQKTGGKST